MTIGKNGANNPENEENQDTETGENRNSENTETLPPETGQDGIPGAIEGIADTLADEAPEVQEHAIAAAQAEEQARQEEMGSMVDDDGVQFDPAIHATDKDGNPSITKTGKFRRKAGRKQNGSVIGNSRKSKLPEMDEAQKQKATARANGIATAELIFALGVGIGGEEWKPIRDEKSGIDERQYMADSWAAYYEATGKQDLPPGLIVCTAIASYAAPRFTMPQTQSRFGKLKTWISKKMADRKLKKHGLKATERDNQERGR